LSAHIAAVIIIVVVLLIVGIPSRLSDLAIQDRVERETDYRLTIAGSTTNRPVASLNVTLHDITLQDPKDATPAPPEGRQHQADMTLSSVWSGHPQITELVITRPVLHHPLRASATGANQICRPATSTGGTDANDSRSIT